jgi:hypothetical protein
MMMMILLTMLIMLLMMIKSFLILVTIRFYGDNSCFLKVILPILINFTLFQNYHYLHLVVYENTTTTSTSSS